MLKKTWFLYIIIVFLVFMLTGTIATVLLVNADSFDPNANARKLYFALEYGDISNGSSMRSVDTKPRSTYLMRDGQDIYSIGRYVESLYLLGTKKEVYIYAHNETIFAACAWVYDEQIFRFHWFFCDMEKLDRFISLQPVRKQ